MAKKTLAAFSKLYKPVKIKALKVPKTKFKAPKIKVIKFKVKSR